MVYPVRSLFLLGILSTLSYATNGYFVDDFTTNEINNSIWIVSEKPSFVDGAPQFYRVANVKVFNSSAHIIAKREGCGGREYTSGRLDTQPCMAFLFADIEIRAKVPRGNGFWSQFFLTDPRCKPAEPCEFWPPSMAIADIFGKDPNKVGRSLFSKGLSGQADFDPDTTASVDMRTDLSSGFHVYRLVWTNDSLLWMVDGKDVMKTSPSSAFKVPRVPLQLSLNLHVGSQLFGNPDDSTPFPAELVVDYVKVQKVYSSSLDQIDLYCKNPVTSEAWIAGPVVGAVVGVLLVICLIVLLVVRRRRRALRAAAIVGTGLCSDHALLKRNSVLTKKGPKSSIDCFTKHDPELERLIGLYQIPYASLETEDEILGRGHFGLVTRGKYRANHNSAPVDVAIKAILVPNGKHANADEENVISEVKVMAKVGKHLNIVNLLGVISKGRLMLILEFCQNGSLLEYLRAHREQRKRKSSKLYDLKKSLSEKLSTKSSTKSSSSIVDEDLTENQMIDFAFQVSRGMEYLASRHIIHRDLAARNVLIATNNILKISDFGLSRQHEETYYSEGQIALPVKWMPPESIIKRAFSEKSDVWSFGVLVWEIFTLGDVPYSELVFSEFEAFVNWLCDGNRLPRPPNTPDFMFDMMCDCWRCSPEERPSFSQLRALLAGTAPDSDTYLHLDEPYQVFNQNYLGVLAVLPQADIKLPSMQNQHFK